MPNHTLIMRDEFFGSVLYNTSDKEYYFFDKESSEALKQIYSGTTTPDLLEFIEELQQNKLLSQNIRFVQEPFAKLETALYEVPAPEDASIFPNSMAKAIDEGISRHNLVPPQIESVYSFAKGSQNEKNNRLSAPLKVFVDITYRCNLRCAHCFTDSREKLKEELTKDHFFSLIDQMANAGTMMLALAGGEPLLHPDFFEIVSYAISKGIKVGMTTNGLLLTSSVAKRLQDLDITTISVSLDGSEEHHDAIRGKGTFSKVVENIEIARKYCKKTKLGIRYTINALNLFDFESTLALADEIGLDVVKFNPIRPFGRALSHPNLLITQEQYIHFLNSVQKVQCKTKYSLPKTPLDSCEYDFIDLGFGCTAGKETCNITPTGDFSGCAFLGNTFVVGNIKTTPFLRLWESTQKTVHCEGNQTCKTCSSYSQCRAGCRNRALFEFGNINAIDPLCTLKKTTPQQKLNIRKETDHYLVFDYTSKQYKKFDTFDQIKQTYPIICNNQQYRLIQTNCPLPTKIFFDITAGCNSQCIHCYNNSSKQLSDELTKEEISALAETLESLGIHQVSIAGGEPFLRKDLFEIIDLFEKHHIQTSITTNGLLLTDTIVEKLSSSPVHHITISIDGFTRDQYHTLRGIDGFDVLSANIKRLHKSFQSKTSMRVSLMKGNTDARATINYALLHGFKTIKINKTHLLGRFNSHQEYFLSDDEYEKALDDFEAFSKTSLITIELPREKYLNHQTPLPCSAGKKTISISPRGDVFPCAFGPNTFSFGSLRKKSLLEILMQNKNFSVENSFCLACPGMKKKREKTST